MRIPPIGGYLGRRMNVCSTHPCMVLARLQGPFLFSSQKEETEIAEKEIKLEDVK